MSPKNLRLLVSMFVFACYNFANSNAFAQKPKKVSANKVVFNSQKPKQNGFRKIEENNHTKSFWQQHFESIVYSAKIDPQQNSAQLARIDSLEKVLQRVDECKAKDGVDFLFSKGKLVATARQEIIREDNHAEIPHNKGCTETISVNEAIQFMDGDPYKSSETYERTYGKPEKPGIDLK